MQSDPPHELDGQGSAGVEPNKGEPRSGDAKFKSVARPTWLTVIAVLCLLPSINGLCAVAFALVMMPFAGPLEDAIQNLRPEMAEFDFSQAEISARPQWETWANSMFAYVNIVIVLCYTASGVGIFLAKPWSRTLLVRVLPIAILVEICWIVFVTTMQITSDPITQEHVDAMLGDFRAHDGESMKNTMQVMQYVVLAFSACWVLLKVGMMLWGRHYLNTPAARAYFRTP